MIRKKNISARTAVSCLLLFSSLFSYSQTDKRIGLAFNNFKNAGAKNQFSNLSQLIPKGLSISFETDTVFKVLDINNINFKRLNAFKNVSQKADSVKADFNFNDFYYVVDTTEEIRKVLIQNNVRYFITGKFTSFQDKISISFTPMVVRQKYFSPLSEITSTYNKASQIYGMLTDLTQRLRTVIALDSLGKTRKRIDFLCPVLKGADRTLSQGNTTVFASEVSGYLTDELVYSPGLAQFTFTPYEKTKKLCNKTEQEAMQETKSDGAFRINYQWVEGTDSIVFTLNFLLRNFNEGNFIEIEDIRMSLADSYYLTTQLYNSTSNFLQAALTKDSTWDYAFLECFRDNNKDRFMQIGKGYLSMGNWPAAAVCYAKVLNTDKNNITALNSLAEANFNQYYYDQARTLYLRSLNLDSVNNYEAMTGLGNTYFQLGDFTSANILFKHIKNKQPDYPFIDLLIGKTYLLADSIDLAKQYIEASVEKNNTCFDCYYLLGQTYENAGVYDKAIAYYKKAGFISPEKTEAKNNLASLLFNLGNASFYEKDYKTALSYYSQSDSAMRNVYSLDRMRIVLDNIGEYAKADEIVNLMIGSQYYTRDSIYYDQASVLSNITDSAGNPSLPAIKKSIEYLAKFDSLINKPERTVTLYGVNYFNLNDYQNTLKYYRMATTLDSTNIYSYLNLAEFLITTCDTNNVHEALFNSEKALAKLDDPAFAGKQLNEEDKLVAYYLSSMALRIIDPKNKKRAEYGIKINELYKNVGMVKIWSFTTFYNFVQSGNCCYTGSRKEYLAKQTKRMMELTENTFSFRQ